MSYVQGFLAPVPSARKADYIKMSEVYWPLFQEYGALSMRECWGDDVPDGEHTSFPMAVKAKDGEVVVFSWIEWKSKADYDACGKSMQSDTRWEELSPFEDAPFDMKRLMWGGFEVVFSG